MVVWVRSASYSEPPGGRSELRQQLSTTPCTRPLASEGPCRAECGGCKQAVLSLIMLPGIVTSKAGSHDGNYVGDTLAGFHHVSGKSGCLHKSWRIEEVVPLTASDHEYWPRSEPRESNSMRRRPVPRYRPVELSVALGLGRVLP